MLTTQEFYRQILHAVIGVLTVILFYYNLLSPLAIFLMIISGIVASFLSKRIRLPVFSFFLDKCERDNDKKTFPGKGMVFFFVGVLLVIQLFEKNIALAAMMILALGDSVSHLIGGSFGQIKNIFNGKSKKLFEGTIAGTIAGFLGALFFVPLPEALVGSFAAMIAEVVEIDFNHNTLDDNIVVPLVAGTVIFLMRNYL
ncbi:MAG: SEC59/DGK1/VTE5 family protein [Nanoarchaeota archaeon]|nr:SEC59/DGK1/VTE5 family protein [Nanoarchaeota archaeon]